ncbi:MAG TPA: ankyrin repeat domain-containing protein [Vicinamibacterales bacterium]|nr:ankyrin repeat domain-containing protein [Vicinamibacterales bacterium]
MKLKRVAVFLGLWLVGRVLFHAALLFSRWRCNLMERLSLRANLAEYGRQMERVDIQKEVMTDEDARLVVARWYDFREWAALRDWVEAMTLDGSPVSSTAEDRHRAMALAAQLGQTEIVGVLIEAGEDPNRYNPKAVHGHSTPLHQAVAAGKVAVVRLLVEHGARLDIRDTIWNGTPLGWADYCGQPEIAAYLRTHVAP